MEDKCYDKSGKQLQNVFRTTVLNSTLECRHVVFMYIRILTDRLLQPELN